MSFAIPTCPDCGAMEWHRSSRMRLECHLTAVGTWAEHDDDYLSDNVYYCAQCKHDPSGDLRQSLIDIKD